MNPRYPRRSRLPLWALSFLLLLLAIPLHAAPETLVKNPLEPADTSSPRSTLYSFIQTANQAYEFGLTEGRGGASMAQRKAVIQKVGDHLDIHEIPLHIRIQETANAAASLKEILDRVEIPAPEDIPGGDSKDLPARWKIPHTDISLVRMTEGPNAGEYLFSAKSVELATDFYNQIKGYPYRTDGPPVSKNLYNWYTTEPGNIHLARFVTRLPAWFRTRWGAQTVWQWAGLILTLIIGLSLMVLGYRVGNWRAGTFKGANTLRYLITVIFPLIVVLIPMQMMHIVRNVLMLSGTALHVINFLLGLLLLFSVMGVVWAVGNRITAILVATPRWRPKGADPQLLRLICRLISIFAVVVIFLEGGKRLGIPLSTLLAGAGIGGFAIAMAAQDSLKNILGSMMITLDKPFLVGERIIAKGMDGTVTEIGLRSTKLKLVTGHAASIPNEEMAKTPIENVGKREHIRRCSTIRIPLNTSREKVERAVQIIEELLQNHEGMQNKTPPRVYLTEFEEDCFKIQMWYWYAPAQYWDFLRFGQELNLQILKAFEKEGIALRLPLRVTKVS